MTTLDYILIILLVLAVLAAVYFFLTRRKAAKKAVAEANEDLKRKIRFSSDEVLRYKTLYENSKNAPNSQPKILPEDNNISPDEVMKTAERIILEQQKLEIEKNEITERNKKLWEMSLAVQKEKEHIEFLKNDIEEKHHSVTDSISYARRIQLAVLPPKMILKLSFADFFLFWRPRDIVSGDFYWMKRQGEIVAFTVADCTGHGVPGAFMSLLGITFLNEICKDLDANTSPSEVLEKLRAEIISALSQDNTVGKQDDGMDMALCILNLQTKVLKFSGANNPMYLVRNGQLIEHKPIRNPIGSFPVIKNFQTSETQVESGDWIYMFSDGFPDQFGEKSKRKLMYAKFKEVITKTATSYPTDGNAQKQALAVFFDEWRGNHTQVDDVLIGGYKIN